MISGGGETVGIPHSQIHAATRCCCLTVPRQIDIEVQEIFAEVQDSQKLSGGTLYFWDLPTM